MTARAAWLMTIVMMALTGAWAQDAGNDTCRLCSSKKEVRCAPCEGKGRRNDLCVRCKGKGRHDCVACVPLTEESLESKLGAKKMRKGWLPCHNPNCHGGTVRWVGGGKNRCKVCGGKGLRKCPYGSGGSMKCLLCKGKRRLDSVCRNCFGSGRMRCPGCAVSPDQNGCVSCDGSGRRPCQACKDPQRAEGPCTDCSGKGRRVCGDCLGSGRQPCRSCGGCGKVRYETTAGDRAGIRGCEDCRKRGYVTCEWCKKGRADCDSCEKGIRRGSCGRCFPQGTISCGACWLGRYAGFETCAEFLESAGRPRRAARFYETALALAQQHLKIEDSLGKVEKVLLAKIRGEAVVRLTEGLERMREAIKESGEKN